MPREAMPPECAKYLTPADVAQMDELVDGGLPEGAVLCLAPGIYHTSLWITHSIVIKGVGDGEVIIDAGKEDKTIEIASGNAVVSLESLTLQNGSGAAESGANLDIFDSKRVSVRDVVFKDGRSDPGGVLVRLVRGGAATFENCVFTGNEGKLAQALFVYQAATAQLRNCTIVDNRGGAPAVTASWGAHIILENSTIVSKETAALRVVNTGAQAPTLKVTKCLIEGNPILEVKCGGPPQPQPQITIAESALSSTPLAAETVTLRDNVIGPLRLDDKLRPPARSPISHYGASR